MNEIWKTTEFFAALGGAFFGSLLSFIFTLIVIYFKRKRRFNLALRKTVWILKDYQGSINEMRERHDKFLVKADKFHHNHYMKYIQDISMDEQIDNETTRRRYFIINNWFHLKRSFESPQVLDIPYADINELVKKNEEVLNHILNADVIFKKAFRIEKERNKFYSHFLDQTEDFTEDQAGNFTEIQRRIGTGLNATLGNLTFDVVDYCGYARGNLEMAITSCDSILNNSCIKKLCFWKD